MLTAKKFVSQYEQCSDEELYRMYNNAGDYSPEAQETLNSVIENRGGLDNLTGRLQTTFQIKNEMERIKQEVSKLYTSDSSILNFFKI